MTTNASKAALAHAMALEAEAFALSETGVAMALKSLTCDYVGTCDGGFVVTAALVRKTRSLVFLNLEAHVGATKVAVGTAILARGEGV